MTRLLTSYDPSKTVSTSETKTLTDSHGQGFCNPTLNGDADRYFVNRMIWFCSAANAGPTSSGVAAK